MDTLRGLNPAKADIIYLHPLIDSHRNYPVPIGHDSIENLQLLCAHYSGVKDDRPHEYLVAR